MKKSIAVIMILLLCACNKRITHEKTREYDLPEGLKDCRLYYVAAKDEGDSLNVIRCPDSQTTTNWTVLHGKSHTNYSVAIND